MGTGAGSPRRATGHKVVAQSSGPPLRPLAGWAWPYGPRAGRPSVSRTQAGAALRSVSRRSVSSRQRYSSSLISPRAYRSARMCSGCAVSACRFCALNGPDNDPAYPGFHRRRWFIIRGAGRQAEPGPSAPAALVVGAARFGQRCSLRSSFPMCRSHRGEPRVRVSSNSHALTASACSCRDTAPAWTAKACAAAATAAVRSGLSGDPAPPRRPASEVVALAEPGPDKSSRAPTPVTGQRIQPLTRGGRSGA
jgi:hypothetical protein